MTRAKPTRVQRTNWKGPIKLPNIHVNKGKYPYSGKELLNFSTISGISPTSQVYADKPK